MRRTGKSKLPRGLAGEAVAAASARHSSDHRKLADAAYSLVTLYRDYKGELDWIEAPPKSMSRRWRGRQTFDRNTDARATRADQIREALPHIVLVIRIYDPTWDEASVKPLPPRANRLARPPNGWSRAALAVLREADRPLAVAEIADAICDRYDLDRDTAEEGQRCNTAVRSSLERKSGRLVLRVEGRPIRWALLRS